MIPLRHIGALSFACVMSVDCVVHSADEATPSGARRDASTAGFGEETSREETSRGQALYSVFGLRIVQNQ